MIKTEAATWGSLFSCRGNYQITGDPQSLIETLQVSTAHGLGGHSVPGHNAGVILGIGQET